MITFCSIHPIQAITIISLGQICSVAGAMRDNGLRVIAYPFDWLVSPFPALYQALNDDFEHFLQDDSLTMRMSDRYGILDYYGFHFVHDFPAQQPNDSFAELIGENHVTGGILCDNWRDSLPAVKAKYHRRIERFRNTLLGSEPVYLIRHFDITKDQAIQLRNLLYKKYPQLNFILIILGKSDEMKQDWHLESIKNIYLDENDPKQWQIFFEMLSDYNVMA
jgi:Putative papain-like cysteine peptidase (DUF1796)